MDAMVQPGMEHAMPGGGTLPSRSPVHMEVRTKDDRASIKMDDPYRMDVHCRRNPIRITHRDFPVKEGQNHPPFRSTTIQIGDENYGFRIVIFSDIPEESHE